MSIPRRLEINFGNYIDTFVHSCKFKLVWAKKLGPRREKIRKKKTILKNDQWWKKEDEDKMSSRISCFGTLP